MLLIKYLIGVLLYSRYESMPHQVHLLVQLDEKDLTRKKMACIIGGLNPALGE